MRLVFLDRFIDSNLTLNRILFDEFGLNRRSVDYLLSRFGFTPSLTVDEIDLLELVLLEEYITDNFRTGEELLDRRKEYLQNVRFSNSIRSFKYRYRLPTNGQRTHTNAQTSKKKS